MITNPNSFTFALPENHLPKRLQNYRQDKKRPDVVVKVGRLKYPAHKNVLRKSSPMLNKMFANLCILNDKCEFDEQFVKTNIVEDLFDFFYTAKIVLTIDNALSVCMAAEYLKMRKLSFGCEKFLCETISYRNTLDLLFFSNKINLLELQNSSVICLNENRKFIFNSLKVLRLTVEEMTFLMENINNDKCNAEEKEMMFEMLIEWAEQDSDKRSPSLEVLFGIIPLHELSQEFLSNALAKESIIRASPSLFKLLDETLSQICLNSTQMTVSRQESVGDSSSSSFSFQQSCETLDNSDVPKQSGKTVNNSDSQKMSDRALEKSDSEQPTENTLNHSDCQQQSENIPENLDPFEKSDNLESFIQSEILDPLRPIDNLEPLIKTDNLDSSKQSDNTALKGSDSSQISCKALDNLDPSHQSKIISNDPESSQPSFSALKNFWSQKQSENIVKNSDSQKKSVKKFKDSDSRQQFVNKSNNSVPPKANDSPVASHLSSNTLNNSEIVQNSGIENGFHSSQPTETSRGLKLYCFGSENQSLVSCLDISTSEWNCLTQMPTPRSFFSGAKIGNNIYICGGRSENATANEMEVFNCLTRTWTQLQSMPEARRWCAAAALNGFIYVTGGQDRRMNELSSVIRYNPQTDEWEKVGSMQFPRRDHQLVELNGRLYAIAGYNTKTIEVYKPEDNNWEIVASTRYEHRWFGAVAFNGKIYMISHEGFESYCPETDIHQIFSPYQKRWGSTLVSVVGNLWAIGGSGPSEESKSNFKSTSAIFSFDIANRRWSQLTNMDIDRENLCAFVIDL